MDIIKRFKLLPNSSRKLLSAGIILALIVALPLFIWAITNLNFNPFKRAGSGEPGVCLAQNKTILVTPTTDTNGTCHDIQTAVNAVTGDGYTIQIDPGSYSLNSSVSVIGKTNLTITGNPQSGNGAAVINFLSGSGYGFLFDNTSGSIQWLTIQGGSANGMLSINYSNTFSVGYININSQNSHTMDVHNSSNVSIYNTDIQSSAGALVVGNSSNINISNNKIHHSATGVSIYNSSNVSVNSNLVYANRDAGLDTSNTNNIQISRNTFVGNNTNGNGYAAVSLSGNQALTNEFSYNIVSANSGPGVKGENGLVFSTFEYNDIYGNNPNYYGYANQTGLNHNISANPQLNSANNLYCPSTNSPVIFGSVANFEYMGYIGPCAGTPPPSPSPTPTAPPLGAECGMCGGIAGISCGSGLVCQMNGTPYPDQSGVCVKTNGTSTCGTYTPPPTACTSRPLALTVTPANQKGNPGTKIRYYLSVQNNDDTNCGSPTVNLQIGNVVWPDGTSTANGWTINFGSQSFVVAPGATYSTFVDVTSPTSSYGLGNYSINITATTPNVPQNTSGTNFVYDLTAAQLSQSFDFRIKFAGVTDGAAEGAKANIRFVSSPVADLSTEPVEFHHIGNGVYEAIVTPDYLPPSASNQGYTVYVKGEKHLARKYCQATGQTSECTGNGGITIPAPAANPASFVFDFTGLALQPGDLYQQDGKVDAGDFIKLVGLMAKLSSTLTDQDKLTADLNYDGYINIRDAFLMRKTLETKFDEN